MHAAEPASLVASIPNIPGAWGMVLSGRYLYVAEGSAGAIGRIDLNSPTFARLRSQRVSPMPGDSS